MEPEAPATQVEETSSQSAEVTQDEVTQAPATGETESTETPSEPAKPESLHEKIAKKAAELAAADRKKAEGAETPAPAADVKVEPAAAAYKPNFKFKANNADHEIPEVLRGVIKDAETEKQVREIMEKAHGLEPVKGRLAETRTKLETVEKENTLYKSSISELKEAYNQGDLDTVFSKLRIPEQKILQWIVDKLHYQELPPEQRQVLDARKQAESDARLLAKQNTDLQNQYQEQVSSAKGMQLQMALSKPEIASFAEAFDSKAGKAGAFYDKVCEIGETAFYTRNVDLTPEQAVKEAMDFFGKFVSPAAPAPAATPAATVTPAAPASSPQAAPKSKEPPVIPNVTGKTSSPTKQKPRSIEELKKIAANFT
jgi:hypothetical protein